MLNNPRLAATGTTSEEASPECLDNMAHSHVPRVPAESRQEIVGPSPWMSCGLMPATALGGTVGDWRREDHT